VVPAVAFAAKVNVPLVSPVINIELMLYPWLLILDINIATSKVCASIYCG
jgi:hypothetical protein